ncbi:MAG TPA: SRPBCC domain-containing protein [Anaeromyxobacter sp.]|nr:SRPBCC domain-containing protein [Anaeromyxobacter sp.]
MTEPVVVQRRGAFSLFCRVDVTVHAGAERIWALLTDAPGFPRWNSTVARIEGDIREGERLRVHVPGTERVFTPRVLGVLPNERMTWRGGLGLLFLGLRTFELRPRGNGATDFTMAERFSGLLIPLLKPSMPDFRPVFVRYADDLRREAEQRAL